MQKLRSIGMNGFVLVLLLFVGVRAVAQQDGYLMLIDAENRTPFTARIGETLVQSSDHGHLLFPRLVDSNYQVIIAFPKKNIPDQVFPVAMHKKDQGLILKGTDSSWVMYNWQSRETIKPLREVDSTIFLARGVKRDDDFSRLMAAVVNDSSVMYNIYAGKSFSDGNIAGKQKDSLKTARAGRGKKATPDSVRGRKPVPDLMAANPGGKDTIALASSMTNVPFRGTGAGTSVKKIREVSLKISRKIVFLSEGLDGIKDTVTCFVFFEKESPVLAAKPPVDSLATAAKVTPDSIASVVKARPDSVSTITKTHKDSLASIARARRDSVAAVARSRKDSVAAVAKSRRDSIAASAKNRKDSIAAVAKNRKDSVATALRNKRTAAHTDSVNTVTTTAPAPVIPPAQTPSVLAAVTRHPDSVRAVSKPPATCLQSANESDIESLRSAILNVNSVQDKLSIAYGAFAVKCFSAAQVRTLATLFVSDKSRYRLIEMSAGHVSDPENFTGLGDLLTDKAFLKKFKTLAENKG